MAYGEKISALRKGKGMTQAAMGAKLNVTYQAVSKWERDESDPDFATMSRIAKLFGVPLTYFEDDEDRHAEEDGSGIPAEEEKLLSEQADAAPPLPDAEPASEPPHEGESVPPQSEAIAGPDEPAEPAVAAPAPPAPLGVCTVCGKTVTTENTGVTIPRLVCKACVERKRKAQEELKQKKLAEAKRKRDYIRGLATSRRNKGFIVASIVTVIVMLLMIVSIVQNKDKYLGFTIGGSVVLVLCTFTFTSQMFWHDIIYKIARKGGPLIGTPGVIFTLDLDGLVFLVGVKILFAVLRFLVYIVITVFFWIAAFFLSPFLFVPQLIKINKRIHI